MFKLLDVDIPEWGIYVTTDRNGTMDIWSERPKAYTDHWGSDVTHTVSDVKHVRKPDGTPATLKLPEHIDWKDVIIKL